MRMLLFSDWKSKPCNESFITGVYMNYLNSRMDIFWVKYDKHQKKVIWENEKELVFPLRMSLFMIIHIIRLLNESIKLKIDIVQVRNDPMMGILAWMIAKIKKVPYIYWITAYKYEEKMLDYLEEYNIKEKRKKLFLYIIGKVEKVFVKLNIKLSNHIIVQSDAMKEDLKTSGIVSEKMNVYEMGYDFTNINLNYLTKFKDDTLIYIGSMKALRKLGFLLEVIKLVKQKIPNIKLLMVGGETSDTSFAKLKECVEESDLKNNVIFTGRINPLEVQKLIRKATIGLSALPPYKPFMVSSPTKVIEYLANSIPVIVSEEIKSQRDIVINGNCGIAVEYDIQKFSIAIIKLLRDKEKIDFMGKNGKEYIQRKHNYKYMSNDIYKLFTRLTEN